MPGEDTVQRNADASQSTTERTLRALFWVFMSQGAEAVLYLAILAVLARLLTPADFGVIAAAMIVVRFAKIFSQYGVGSTVVQRPNLGPSHIRGLFTIAWVTHGLLAAALVAAAPAVAAFFRLEALLPILRWLALLFVMQGLSIVAESLLQRELRFRLLTAVDVATFAVGYGLVGIVLAALGFGVWALVGGLLAQTALKTVVLLLLCPHPVAPIMHRATLSELLFYTGGFTTGHLAGFFAHQGDKFVVGRWLGADALGAYTRAYEVMAAPSKFLGGIFDKALFPAIAAVQDNPAQLARAYRRAVAVLALLVLPTTPILIVLAPEVVYVLLGSQWTDVILPLQILTIVSLLRMQYRMSDSLVRASGTVLARAWRQIAYAAMVVAAALVGRYGGLPGVSIGVLAAITWHFLLMTHLCLRLSTLTWRDFLQAHGHAAAITLLLGPLVWLVTAVLRAWQWLPVAVLAAALGCLVVAVGAIVWLAPRRVLGADGLWLVQTLLAPLPDRLAPVARLKGVLKQYDP